MQIRINEKGQRIVIISDILFTNKQNIDWNEVERYLQKYIGSQEEISESQDIIYVGKKFPNEYSGSKYTRSLRGARAKAKANASQVILEMIGIASEKRFRDNRKAKHAVDAEKGWYYYTTRFALPVYESQGQVDTYNIYSACLVVNHASNGKKYLYDIVDVKKEARNPLTTETSHMV